MPTTPLALGGAALAGAPAAQFQVGAELASALAARAARIGGLALVSLAVSATAALAYRWYVREPIPRGLTALLGVGAVAMYLNTIGLFAQLVPSGVPGAPQQQPDLFETVNVLSNTLTLAVAALVTPLGQRVGDGFATNVGAVAGADRVEGEVGRLARTVGRVVPVTLPDEIGTMEGYDPIPESTVERLAGATLILPRRSTATDDLRDRLVTRLKEDYGVSYVDLDLTDDGDVSYLAVGQRVAGLGPTLGPGTCAVAVRADPANAASVGDVVQVWTAGGPDGAAPERVASAELRATVGDVVTLAVDEADASAFPLDREYRLVTLPTDPRTDREFASLLRAADETMGVVTVGADSALVGVPVGDLPGTAIAVRPASGNVDPLPRRTRELAAGDALYVVARPDALRDLEARADDRPPTDAAPGAQP